MGLQAKLVNRPLLAYELVLTPLGAETRERYYADSRLLGALFGIPPETQPPDWPALARYMDEAVASDMLTVGAAARAIGTGVVAGASRIPIPRWYGDVTAALLPEHLRGPFGLTFGEAERRRADRALRLIRRTYPLLPARIRTVGPYQEAMARLSGRRRPSVVTRSLNRLWMGRPSMGE